MVTESLYRSFCKKEDGFVPYEKLTDLPNNVRDNLSKHAQEIYQVAFNSAETLFTNLTHHYCHHPGTLRVYRHALDARAQHSHLR